MKTIYGWTEQHEVAWGVSVIRVDDDCDIELDLEGRWFSTWSEAKRAAIKLWEYQLQTARQALKSIRSERKYKPE